MLRLATFPPATCRIVQLLGCIPAMLVTIFCAWMAALGLNWEVTDGLGNMPATCAILAITLLATCPPPCVLGLTVAAALVGFKMHMLSGALWVSLWMTGALAATFYACCSSMALEGLPTLEEHEEQGQQGCGPKAKAVLNKVRHGIAYAMSIPSSILMNILWSAPSMLTVVPRSLVVVFFELASLVLCSTAHLLILCGRLCGVGLKHHSLWRKDGEAMPLHTDSSRTPVILVSAQGSSAWFVPRLNFLSKSHIFGPVLVFESAGGVNAGIREAAEDLRKFILDALPHEAPKNIILVGHSVGGLISAYYADFLARDSNIKVVSVVCISTPWAGLHEPTGLKDLPLRLLQRSLLGMQNLSGNMMADLDPESSVLKKIQDLQMQPASGCKDSRARFYNLAGTLDVVLAGSSLKIAQRNAFWCCMFPHVGHSSILLSRTVWEQVFVWLQAHKLSVRKGSPGPSCSSAHEQTAPEPKQLALSTLAPMLPSHALGNTHTHSHSHSHSQTLTGLPSDAVSSGHMSASHLNAHTSQRGVVERNVKELWSREPRDHAERVSTEGDALPVHQARPPARPSAHAQDGGGAEGMWAAAIISGRNEPGSPFKGHGVARQWIPPLHQNFTRLWSWDPGNRSREGEGTGNDSV